MTEGVDAHSETRGRGYEQHSVLFVLLSSCMDLRSAAMGIQSNKRRQSLHKEERLSKALFDFIDMHFGRKVWTTNYNEHVKGHCTSGRFYLSAESELGQFSAGTTGTAHHLLWSHDYISSNQLVPDSPMTITVTTVVLHDNDCRLDARGAQCIIRGSRSNMGRKS